MGGGKTRFILIFYFLIFWEVLVNSGYLQKTTASTNRPERAVTHASTVQTCSSPHDRCQCPSAPQVQMPKCFALCHGGISDNFTPLLPTSGEKKMEYKIVHVTKFLFLFFFLFFLQTPLLLKWLNSIYLLHNQRNFGEA